ncbi:MAG: hypothetical protein F6K19_46675 [Cyanothece sp. SIO1E1]|nr:hypothetical protein [Cyanothece sp. SIO1E1]
MATYYDWIMKSFKGSAPNTAIENAANELLKDSGQRSLPISLKIVAEHINLEPRPIYVQEGTKYGYLDVLDKQLRIFLRTKDGKVPRKKTTEFYRTKFSYAHELIHALHFDRTSKPPVRIAPIDDRREERLCNLGAQYLILPKQMVLNVENSISLDNVVDIVEKLSDLADVSFWMAMVSIFDYELIEARNRGVILSRMCHGLAGRGPVKVRCIFSRFFDQKGKSKMLIPPYKGLEDLAEDWSLVRFFQKTSIDNKVKPMKFRNEILNLNGINFAATGMHKKVKGGSYVWTSFDALEF